MSKGDFDYRRAYKEIAEPAFEVLPQNVRDLYERICKDFKAAQQDKNTDMPWPEGTDDNSVSDLWQRFDGIPDDILAMASRVIHYFGHWKPSGVGGDSTGAYWKFAHWADQTLARKCGLPEFQGRAKDRDGISYQVNDGFLRVCFSSKDEWLWEELGIATKPMYEKALKVLPKGKCSVGRYNEKLKELKDLKGWDGGHSLLTPFLDTSDFKEKGVDEQAVIAALENSGLCLHKIENCNFKPHPYCIGSSHLEHSDGILSESSIDHMERYHGVKCGVRGCNLKRSEHTSDRVAFLKIKDLDPSIDKVNLTEPQKAVLASEGMKAIFATHKIDGVAFVR